MVVDGLTKRKGSMGRRRGVKKHLYAARSGMGAKRVRNPEGSRRYIGLPESIPRLGSKRKWAEDISSDCRRKMNVRRAGKFRQQKPY
jgi:hypothetical protein